MNKTTSFTVVLLLSLGSFKPALSTEIESAFSFGATLEHLQQALDAKGMTTFAHINHAKGAEKVGLDLNPTELVIFGNPKVGTLLMQCDQHIGLQLPLKMLIREDAQGRVWLSYDEPAEVFGYLTGDKCQSIVNKVSHAMANFARAATTADK